jgi:class 3 adenylate cyclase/tetratricopeptide (TPR) repeat protein
MSTAREVRKTVTIVFCDLVHSTGLAEGDPEAYRRVQWRYFEAMRGVVERHGGTVEKFIGDEVMAVFGVPTTHEDDALRAVRAADYMLDGARELGLEVRVGVNTGEVIAGDPSEGQAFVSGEAVIVAKRLEQAAEPGEILIGKATYPLVSHAVSAGPLERLPVKGKRDDVGRRRLEEVDRDAPAVARRRHVPIVGRDEEIELLLHAFDRAVEERSVRLFTVLGPPGIGKSRLAAELASRLGERATPAVGHCLSYGVGITYWPLTEILRELGGEEAAAEALEGEQREPVLEVVRGLTGSAEAAGSGEETFRAVRHVLEALARRRPLVLCFEDLHWAEQTLLDLVEYLAGWSRSAPMLILCLARPDLVERRPTWISPRANADAVALEPLSRPDSDALLADLAGEFDLPGALRERIGEAAEGNPLFLEQMAAMAAEKSEDLLSVPPSIQALLAERLDRLTQDERVVLERASIVGRDFSLAAVSALGAAGDAASLQSGLLALARKGLIQPGAASDVEDRFTFQHVLVRDAAYEATSKALRAELHKQLADWMELSGDVNLPELVGYHLEQAFRYRHELDIADEQTERLRVRAGDLLGAAGNRALARNDAQGALKFLRRAVELRTADDPAVDVRLDLALALLNSGELAGASEVASTTEVLAAASGDEVGEWRARLLRARIAVHAQSGGGAGSEGPSADLLAVAAQARPVFIKAGHEHALAESWLATAYTVGVIRCQWAAMLEAVEHALEHARRAGSTRWDGELPAWKSTALFYGPTPVADAMGWYEEQQPKHPVALTQQAMLEAMRGNFDRARILANSAEETAAEFGQNLWLAVGGMALWEIETLAGDVSAAEEAVRRSCELLENLGEVGYRYNAVSQLAASLVALGRLDEAEELTRAAQEGAAPDDISSQILWRQARALVLARRGEADEAVRLASAAVSLAEETDMLNWQARALADLAEAYVAGERLDETRATLARAISLFERKGNTLAAEHARERLETLATGR